MTFHAAFTCDGPQCMTNAECGEEFELLQQGWHALRSAESDEETMTREFCSLRCLADWAESEA